MGRKKRPTDGSGADVIALGFEYAPNMLNSLPHRLHRGVRPSRQCCVNDCKPGECGPSDAAFFFVFQEFITHTANGVDHPLVIAELFSHGRYMHVNSAIGHIHFRTHNPIRKLIP